MSQVTLHTRCVAPPIDKIYHKVSKLPQHWASGIIRYDVNSARWSFEVGLTVKINGQPTFSKLQYIILWKLGCVVIFLYSIHSRFTFQLIFVSHCSCNLFNKISTKFSRFLKKTLCRNIYTTAIVGWNLLLWWMQRIPLKHWHISGTILSGCTLLQNREGSLRRFEQITFILHIRLSRDLSYERSTASSKASSPHSTIWHFLFQFTVSSPFFKVIQKLNMSSS